MPLALSNERIRYEEADPVLWLFGQCVLNGDCNLIVSQYLVKVLSTTFLVILDEAQLFNFSLMFLKEVKCVKCLEGLLPHLHYEEVGI